MPDLPILLGLLVAFIVIVFPLNAALFRPLMKTLEARDERIAGTRAKAERLEVDTQAVLARYNTAIQEAREASEGERRQRLEETRARVLETTTSARETAERELERARAELGSTLDEARSTLRTRAGELARDAASSVLGRPL